MIGKKLKKLRTDKNLRQYEVAEIMGVSQKNICTIEAKKDLHLATLNRYLMAIGGRLKISAEFTDEGISYDLSDEINLD
jgi:transcriptional regulator with XRE-family HTH domain